MSASRSRKTVRTNAFDSAAINLDTRTFPVQRSWMDGYQATKTTHVTNHTYSIKDTFAVRRHHARIPNSLQSRRACVSWRSIIIGSRKPAMTIPRVAVWWRVGTSPTRDLIFNLNTLTFSVVGGQQRKQRRFMMGSDESNAYEARCTAHAICNDKR